MAWMVGIDEAGYGPNLGPLVMSVAACRLPAEAGDLWEVLHGAARRPEEADDGRLVVGDSKLVYSSTRGLRDLETSVLAILTPEQARQPITLDRYLASICRSHPQVQAERWYVGARDVPTEADPARLGERADHFHTICRQRAVRWDYVRSVAVCPRQFNGLLDRWGSKGAVLGHALTELLACLEEFEGETEPVRFFIDKHGGRNTYAAMLQHALPAGIVVAEEEGSLRSVYRVLGLKREVRFTFQPRADAEHFTVALASMLSKYLRELLMREFNEFWQGQVTNLKPTAGYPIDAARFYDAIRPVAQRLGIAEEAVWRRK